VAVAPFVCQIAVSALFEPSVRAQTVSQSASIRNCPLVAAVTPLLDNEQVNMPQLTAGVQFLGGGSPVVERLSVERAGAA
jgi:hypothetical protein